MNMSISKNQLKALKFFVDFAEKNKINYAFDGGFAAILYGSKRKLYDFDVWTDRKGIEIISKKLKKFVEKPFVHEADTEWDEWCMELKVFGELIDIALNENCYYLKNGKKIDLSSRKINGKTIEFNGIKLKVTPLKKLIESKKLRGRECDLEDLKYLEKNRKA